MSESDTAADASLEREPEYRAGPGWLVRPAPAPDLPEARDKAGAQRGMAIGLIGGAAFWAAVAAAVVWFTRR